MKEGLPNIIRRRILKLEVQLRKMTIRRPEQLRKTPYNNEPKPTKIIKKTMVRYKLK